MALVLDNYLSVVADFRRTYKLTSPRVGLVQIEAEPVAKKAIEAIIDDTIGRHGSEIYSTLHPLLAEEGSPVYAEEDVQTGACRCKIHPTHIRQALGRTIEVGLQTIVQLPSRESKKPVSAPKRFRSLASMLTRSAERLDKIVRDGEVRGRINLWKDQGSQGRLFKLASEIEWGVEALNSVADLKVKKIRTDSPSPQIRLAMYVIGWIEAATGSKQYGNVTKLVDAAFCAAAGASPPRWVDRLAIEMHLKKKWRKQWARTISS